MAGIGRNCLKNLRFLRLQRDQRLTLWYIGKRKQGFLRNHATPQCTFLTPVGNRCITPCVCVKEPSRAREVIPTAGGLYVHKGTVFCRTIRRHIQRYWILRRLGRSISCSACVPPEWKGGTPATVVIGKIAFAFPIHSWPCAPQRIQEEGDHGT